jgi:integrase
MATFQLLHRRCGLPQLLSFFPQSTRSVAAQRLPPERPTSPVHVLPICPRPYQQEAARSRLTRVGRVYALNTDDVYKHVRPYALALGSKIGAHALRASATTNALDHDADIAKVQEWLCRANIATTRIYDRRKMKPEDSPTFE